MSNSLQPQGLQPARLLCPWDFPGKNTGVGCHFLLQGIFPTQGSNPGLPHCRQTLYCLSHQGSPHQGRGDQEITKISVQFSSVVQSCLTLCDPMDCSPPGSFVHGIFQERILEWVAISFSRVSSQPRDRTQVSHTAGRFFTTEPPGKSRNLYF